LQIQVENLMELKINEYIVNCRNNGIQMTWDRIALMCDFSTRQNLKRVCSSENPTILSLLKVSNGLNISIFDLINIKYT
jgi:hypothetical protein